MKNLLLKLSLGILVALIPLITDYTFESLPYTTEYLVSDLIFNVLIIVLLLTLTIIEFVSALQIYDSTYHTVLVSFFLLGYFIFSDSFYDFLCNFELKPNYEVFEIFSFLFLILVFQSLFHFFQYTYKVFNAKHYKISSMLMSAFCLACFVIYCVLISYNLQYIAYYVLIFGYSCLFIASVLKIKKDLNAIFYFSALILFAVFGMSNVDILRKSNLLSHHVFNWDVGYSILIIVFFLSIYFTFIVESSKQAQKTMEYQLQLSNLKNKYLVEQIKPHYIFNCLESIKSSYHDSLNDGDKVLTSFSKYLRSNVESLNQNLIPFTNELNNINNFLDLENLRQKRDLNVIFNIDYEDFLIPIFSIEPFFENAIKYSGFQNIDDGYIEISSFKEGDYIIIEVADNGIGFDTKSIKSTSIGIKNSCERIKLILNGTVTIDSAIGKGTTVKIKFLEKKQWKY